MKWVYKNLVKHYKLIHYLQTLGADKKHRKLVTELANPKSGSKVLDIGTGTGLTAIKLSLMYPNCTVTGIDESGDMLKKAAENIQRHGLKKKINLLKGNLEDLTIKSNSFNVITSCYGLGGVKNIEKAFRELVRVATPNSVVCLAEMTEPSVKFPIRRFIHNCLIEPWIKFFWGFRDLDLFSLCKQNGIEIVEKLYLNDRFFGSTMLIKGIVKKSNGPVYKKYRPFYLI